MQLEALFEKDSVSGGYLIGNGVSYKGGKFYDDKGQPITGAELQKARQAVYSKLTSKVAPKSSSEEDIKNAERAENARLVLLKEGIKTTRKQSRVKSDIEEISSFGTSENKVVNLVKGINRSVINEAIDSTSTEDQIELAKAAGFDDVEVRGDKVGRKINGKWVALSDADKNKMAKALTDPNSELDDEVRGRVSSKVAKKIKESKQKRGLIGSYVKAGLGVLTKVAVAAGAAISFAATGSIALSAGIIGFGMLGRSAIEKGIQYQKASPEARNAMIRKLGTTSAVSVGAQALGLMLGGLPGLMLATAGVGFVSRFGT